MSLSLFFVVFLYYYNFCPYLMLVPHIRHMTHIMSVLSGIRYHWGIVSPILELSPYSYNYSLV